MSGHAHTSFVLFAPAKAALYTRTLPTQRDTWWSLIFAYIAVSGASSRTTRVLTMLFVLGVGVSIVYGEQMTFGTPLEYRDIWMDRLGAWTAACTAYVARIFLLRRTSPVRSSSV